MWVCLLRWQCKGLPGTPERGCRIQLTGLLHSALGSGRFHSQSLRGADAGSSQEVGSTGALTCRGKGSIHTHQSQLC